MLLIFSVNSLEYKKGITITNAFQNILRESNGKPKKIWVNKGSEFYNRSMKYDGKSKGNNGGKSVIAERFIRTLKNKFYKYVFLISKNGHIDKLDDIVNKYNNTYHNTIKIMPVDVKSSTYIEIKIGNIVRILTYKNIFAKTYVLNWSEEVFMIKNVKNTVPWTYVISDLKCEKIVGMFYEKELQKANQKEFKVKKVQNPEP